MKTKILLFMMLIILNSTKITAVLQTDEEPNCDRRLPVSVFALLRGPGKTEIFSISIKPSRDTKKEKFQAKDDAQKKHAHGSQ